MGREMLEKTIGELVSQHISIYDEMEGNSMLGPTFARQLDFLEFWVSSDAMAMYSPWKDMDGNIIPPRDNPNMELTEYENVYRKVTLKSIDYEYSADGRAPVSIMQWYRSENQHKQGWKISIYGKGLRLYYNGLLPWLPDYVKMYQSETIRADICWDRQGEKIPAGVIDLKCMVTVPDDKTWTYKMFGNGDLTARIYDKSLDLMKKDKGIHSWLYPDWYQNNCWRVEFVFRGKYARSLCPCDWLLQCPTDGKIKPIDYGSIDKAFKTIKALVYNVVMLVEQTILTPEKQLQIYVIMKDLVTRKIEKLSKNKGLQ